MPPVERSLSEKASWLPYEKFNSFDESLENENDDVFKHAVYTRREIPKREVLSKTEETPSEEVEQIDSQIIHDDKQDWAAVDPTAWVILISISVECFIEGIALSLSLRHDFGGGIAVLAAMLTKSGVKTL